MTKLLCLGDSITDCGRIFFQPPLGNGYVRMLAQQLAFHQKDWTITNCGVDGFTISRLIDNLDRTYLPLQPDIVTVLIGINDVGLMMNTDRTSLQKQNMIQEFFTKYETLLQRLHKPGRQIILMEPFIFQWPEEYYYWIPYVQAMSEGIAALAKTHGLPYVLLQERLNQEAQKYGLDFVTTDGIHLTSHGHEVLADALFKELSHISDGK